MALDTCPTTDIRMHLKKKYKDYVSIIDQFPPELFFGFTELEQDDPILANCTSPLTLTNSSFIIKIIHRKTAQEMAIFFEKSGLRFRISGGSDPYYFEELTRLLKKDPNALLEVVEGEHPNYELLIPTSL